MIFPLFFFIIVTWIHTSNSINTTSLSPFSVIAGTGHLWTITSQPSLWFKCLIWFKCHHHLGFDDLDRWEEGKACLWWGGSRLRLTHVFHIAHFYRLLFHGEAQLAGSSVRRQGRLFPIMGTQLAISIRSEADGNFALEIFRHQFCLWRERAYWLRYSQQFLLHGRQVQ